MDPATVIGLLLAFGSVIAMVTMEGGSVAALLLPAPMILVFGATLAVGIAGNTLKDVIQAFKALPKMFHGKTSKPQESIDQVVRFAEKARSEGLLSLEEEAASVKDPFLTRALQNIADGTDAEELRMLMEDEIDSKARSDHSNSKFFASLGGYAPTVGIIGTVVSLTHVLENLSTPDELGPMIASAFVATLWGLLSANFLWLPFSGRLARLSELDIERMTLLMEGMLAVQAGAQPLLLAERLRSMVPEHQLKASSGGQEGRRQGQNRPAGPGSVSSRRRGRKKPEQHHVDERWMASYMDMVTVLMCMFIVLYAMSSVDANKFEKLRNSLATGFGAVASQTVDTASGTVVAAGTRGPEPRGLRGRQGRRNRIPGKYGRGGQGSGPAQGAAGEDAGRPGGCRTQRERRVPD